jgi:hypothetical protein
MGCLNRLFGVGGIFHSSDGLTAQRLGPQQLACAQAFIEGSFVWPDATTQFGYYNVGHTGSPIASATFNEGDLGRPGCTRSYSFLVGGAGLNVTLGISDMNNPGARLADGWAWGETVGAKQGVLVREVHQ